MYIYFKKIEILIILLLIIFSNYLYDKNFNNFNTKYLDEKFESRDEAFNKSINFIKKCLTSDIFKFDFNFKFIIPEISVIIPLYNCEKFIFRTIKSIQYQNYQNYEIILVDDNSNDNTINNIEKLKSEDKRIKLIKNKKNKGILYSRSIGVLSSKGKYLFSLDNDDIFLNEDIFSNIKKFWEKRNFDIIEFKAITNQILNNDILNNTIEDALFSHRQLLVLSQPELGRFPIQVTNSSLGFKFNDIFLWGKCIKTKIYKKTINEFGYNRYSRYMINYEDILTNYAIFNIARSFLFIPTYGIYHIKRKGSGESIGYKKILRYKNILYLTDIAIDFSQDNYINKKLVTYLIIYFLSLKNLKQNLAIDKYNYELFISCFKRILKSIYIHENDKNKIKNKIKNVGVLSLYKNS